MKRLCLLLWCVAAATAGRAGADLHFVQSTDIGAMHFTAETWISGSRLRCRSVEPATAIELLIDTAGPSFSLADESELEFLTAKFNLEKQGPGIAKMRGKAGKVTVRETGATQTVGTWSASEVRVEQAKSFALSVWVARDARNEEWERWLREFPLDELSRRWDVTQLAGLPVKIEGTMTVDGVTVPFVSTLERIDTDPVDPTALEMPKQYEKSKFGVFHQPGTPDKKAVRGAPKPR